MKVKIERVTIHEPDEEARPSLVEVEARLPGEEPHIFQFAVDPLGPLHQAYRELDQTLKTMIRERVSSWLDE